MGIQNHVEKRVIKKRFDRVDHDVRISIKRTMKNIHNKVIPKSLYVSLFHFIMSSVRWTNTMIHLIETSFYDSFLNMTLSSHFDSQPLIWLFDFDFVANCSNSFTFRRSISQLIYSFESTNIPFNTIHLAPRKAITIQNKLFEN